MGSLIRTAEIDDQEVLGELMNSLNEIARVNYDYMEEYITDLGNITMKFINSEYLEVATMSIEFWTSLCEVEMERDK